MAALWSADFTIVSPGGNAVRDGFTFGAADARTMKRADIRAAIKNAQATAKKRPGAVQTLPARLDLQTPRGPLHRLTTA